MPGIYAVFVVALFSALRLAKFNIDEEQKEEFVGLNTPACAIFVTSAGWLYANGAFTIQPWIVLAVAVLLSVLLISPIRMFSFKFKSYALRPNALRYAFLLLSVIALGLFRIAAVPFIIMGYVVVSIGRNIVCSRQPKMTTK